jgi:hypothetical protein
VKAKTKSIAKLGVLDSDFRKDLIRALRVATAADRTGFFNTQQYNTVPALRYHTSETGSAFVARAKEIVKAAQQLREPTDNLAASIALRHFRETAESTDPQRIGPRRRFQVLINELEQSSV